MPKIEQMYAFVAVQDGDEGIIGFNSPGSGGWVPLVGADMARVEDYRIIARKIGEMSNIEVQLLKFTNREECGPA